MGRDIITLWDEVNFKAEERGWKKGWKEGWKEGREEVREANAAMFLESIQMLYGRISPDLEAKVRKLVFSGESNHVMRAFATTQTLDAFEAVIGSHNKEDENAGNN